ELHPPFFQLRRRFLQEHVRAGDRALDLGCGNGAFTAALEQAGADAVGVDVAEEALRRARKAHPGMRFMLAPFSGPLPLEDLAFDLVWASEVIEHVADTARWLSEVKRVLRPGGSLLVTTPNHSRLAILVRGLEHFAEPLSDHLHLYTRKSLRETLERLHFRQIDVRAAGGPPLMRALLLAHAVR
ncbi:MAG: class I SAM-dependent methyltransferase, partial [Solirubrobacterales bacterium]|nr:class I SAM-dependent methyltransferase [Solirubrobacterales bacterium]